jgi:hypothetical protein
MVNDGLARTNIDATTFRGTTINANANNVGGQIMDMGTITSSGNTSVVTFAKSFSAAPSVHCIPTVGSVSVANQSVLSNVNAGSFSVATGSNIANSWIAIGSA